MRKPRIVIPEYDFADAIRFLKQGKKVARVAWAGTGMWVLRQGVALSPIERGGEYLEVKPYFGLRTSNGEWTPWNPSQEDMHAEDYIIVE